MADNAGTERSRRAKASGSVRTAKGPLRHAVEAELRLTPKRRRRPVSLPLVRSKQPGTVVLDNAKIFEIIPFP